MMPQTGLFAAALRRIRPRVMLPFGGNLLVLLTVALALKIPDSHIWQVLLSVLLGLGIISALLLWNAVAVRRLRAAQAPVPLWSGALLAGAWLLFAGTLVHLAMLADVNVETRAGFWNSQMSSALRHVLTYSGLVAVQHRAIAIFSWLLLPALLIPFAIETVTFGANAKAAGRALRVLVSIQHWVTAAIALGVAAWLVPVLIAWHPLHTVIGEVISALLRLGVAAVLAAAAVVLLMSTDAELLARRATTPQPLTSE